MVKKYIVLLTDFGNDFYVGQMKGVIKSICSDVEIIDLTHNIQPQNIIQASIIISESYKYFPENSIFICVVDPEVGSTRKIILVKKNKYIFLAPNNGVLTKIIDKNCKIYEVVNRKYFLKKVSYTFHGRDIFSPIAGFLAKNLKIEKLCKKINRHKIVNLYFPKINIKKIKSKTYIYGKYLFYDSFGNIITNLRISNIDSSKKYILYVYYKNKKYYKLDFKNFYSEVNKGKFLALVNSFSYVEVAKNCGNAYLEFVKKFKDLSNINFVLVKNERQNF